jgi:hypothetical protein
MQPKRRVARLRALAACVALLPCSAQAQLGLDFDAAEDWTVSASVSRLRPEVAGDLELGEDFGATPIDVESDLDLSADDVYRGRAEWKFGAHHLRFDYLPVRYEGDAVLTAPVLVFGMPFLPGDRVVSEVGTRRYQLAYRYDIHLAEHVVLAPVLALDLVDAWIDLDNRSVPGARLSEDVLAPVPLPGVRFEVRPLPRLELFVEARGVRATDLGDLSDVRIWGGEGGLALLLSRNLVLRGSYAVDDYSVTLSDVAVDLRQAGPSLELELRF